MPRLITSVRFPPPPSPTRPLCPANHKNDCRGTLVVADFHSPLPLEVSFPGCKFKSKYLASCVQADKSRRQVCKVTFLSQVPPFPFTRLRSTYEQPNDCRCTLVAGETRPILLCCCTTIQAPRCVASPNFFPAVAFHLLPIRHKRIEYDKRESSRGMAPRHPLAIVVLEVSSASFFCSIHVLTERLIHFLDQSPPKLFFT